MTAWKPEPSSGATGIVPPVMPTIAPSSSVGLPAQNGVNLSLPGVQSGYSFDDDGGVYVGRAPWEIIVAAALLALLGGILGGFFGGSPIFAFAGWFIAGPIVMALLAFFALRDTKVRARGVYNQLSFVPFLYWIAMGLCIAATLVCAWRIGDWVGRL